jgi:hypothetical protein
MPNDYGQRLVWLIDAKFAADEDEDGMRTHLGGSILGEKCMRAVWFSFRWAARETLEGRMLRLFARGHREEATVIDLLRRIGATVWAHGEDGAQFRISDFGGHLGGELDSVACGLPELPSKLAVLLEIKTHNDKRFKQLQKEGLIKGYPKHYKQAQVYMHKANIKHCLYCAVNKNDDELWFYFFDYDPNIGNQLMMRAETIIFGSGLPPRISETPSWFECTFCIHKQVCFKFEAPKVNCRTCRFSKPERNGTWSCANNRIEVDVQPKIGCPLYQVIPELV